MALINFHLLSNSVLGLYSQCFNCSTVSCMTSQNANTVLGDEHELLPALLSGGTLVRDSIPLTGYSHLSPGL